MHPNGQMPAYEWAFGDVNPPVHAWAAARIYQIEGKRSGARRPTVPRTHLPEAADQLHLVGQPQGRKAATTCSKAVSSAWTTSAPSTAAPSCPSGGHLEQADGTSWMAMYCLNMLGIALELAKDEPGLRGRGDQVLRTLRLHRRGGEPHRRRPRRAVGRAGRFLLRHAQAARRPAPSDQGLFDRRPDADVRHRRGRPAGPGGFQGLQPALHLVPAQPARPAALPGRHRPHRRERTAPSGAGRLAQAGAAARQRARRTPPARAARHPLGVQAPPGRIPSCSSSKASASRSTTSRANRTAACSAAIRTGAGRCGFR